MIGERVNGDFGAFSGSMKLLKESLSEDIQKELNYKGFAVIPLPKELRNEKKLDIKVCQQYALHEFAENIIRKIKKCAGFYVFLHTQEHSL